MSGYDSDWAREQIETGAIWDDAAPDRPGDRDQQQAAEVAAEALNELYEGRRPGEMALDYTARIEQILDRVRAEETARWRAKIEAATRELDHWAKTRRGDKAAAYSHTADMLRAVLDAER